VIVDATVQENVTAHPVDSRLIEIARHEVVSAASCGGSQLKQTFAKEGKALRRRVSGYAHAKQFRRSRTVLKPQRTILDIRIREVQRRLEAPVFAPAHPKAVSDLMMWLGRAGRIRTQQRKGTTKLYALHAPDFECLAKGKARKPYEFCVKSAVVVSHKHGLMLGARTFPGTPYDGHILDAALEQASKLCRTMLVTLKQIVVNLGLRGVDADNPDVEIIHRGKYKSLTTQQKRRLRRRQALEPAICHEVRHPHGPLLAARDTGRGTARHQLCSGLQPALAAAGDRPRGPWVTFLRLLQVALSQSPRHPQILGTYASAKWHPVTIPKRSVVAIWILQGRLIGRALIRPELLQIFADRAHADGGSCRCDCLIGYKQRSR